jgi:hypothetical protein
MSKTDRNQQLLNWLNNEKIKDKIQLEKSKEKIISEISSLKKEEMFKQPKKLSLWTKIRMVILGQ